MNFFNSKSAPTETPAVDPHYCPYAEADATPVKLEQWRIQIKFTFGLSGSSIAPCDIYKAPSRELALSEAMRYMTNTYGENPRKVEIIECTQVFS